MIRSSRRWLKAGTGVVVAAVVIGGGYATYAAATTGPSGYRTASVTTADVEQMLALSGTVAPTGRTDLAFGTSGTVSAVAVEGEKVTKGQVVARLDRSSLQTAVTKAKATLASARAQLEADENAQTSAATSSTSTSASTASATDTGTVVPALALTAASTGVRIVSDSGSASSATCSQAIQTALDAIPSADAAAVVTSVASTLPDALTTATGALSDLSDAITTLDDTLSADQPSADDIKAAQRDVETAQQKLDAAKKALTDAQSDLTDAMSKATAVSQALGDTGADSLRADIKALETACASASSGSDGSDDSSGDSSKTGQSGQTGQSDKGAKSGKGQQAQTQPGKGQQRQPGKGQQSPAGGQSTPQGDRSGKNSQSEQPGTTSGSSGRSVTAATIAKDQAAIDQAKADLIAAQQALKGATLRAPAAGTVASVDVAKGDSATAGSDAVTIVSKGLVTVEIDASDTQVRQLKVGQQATVTPAGADTPFAATVTAIGQVPSTSSGSTSYPVTVTLAKRDLDLLTGTTASVDIVIGSADGVLTVPTSAVSNGTVSVLANGKVRRTRVTTGIVGRSRTQITKGLTKGQQVVLADLSAALPTGDGQSGRSGFGGRGMSFSGGEGFGGGPVMRTR